MGTEHSEHDHPSSVAAQSSPAVKDDPLTLHRLAGNRAFTGLLNE